MTNPLAPEWLDDSVDANALVPGIWADSVVRDGEGEITVGGVSASTLAHRFATPLYVVDENHARDRALRVRKAFDAAAERNIPAIRLNDGNLVQLGYGASQRRIWTAETDQTSAIAEGVSKDKDLTKSLLANCGVPVPEGRNVSSPTEAWEAAQDIGLPVCVKPVDGNHARGVSLELRTQAEVEAAYHLAEAEGSDVLVERHILGDEHRLLVVGGWADVAVLEVFVRFEH